MSNDSIANPKKDRRVLRTKRNILNAFINLASKKKLNQITIKELSELADINRKTFYMYYSGVEDILLEIEEIQVQKIIQVFEDGIFNNSNLDAFSFFEILNDKIMEDIAIYRCLYKLAALPFLVSHVKDKLVQIAMVKYGLDADKNRDLYLLYAEYAAGGILSMYTKWLSANGPVSLEELTRTAAELTMNGFKPFITSHHLATKSIKG